MSKIGSLLTVAVVGAVVVVGVLLITVVGDTLFTVSGAFVGLAVARPGVFAVLVVVMLLFVALEQGAPRQPRGRNR